MPRIESRHSDYAGGFPAHFHSLKLGLTDAPWIEVNQHEVKKKFVLEGAGFAILTRPTVARELEDGRLVQIHTPTPLLSPVFWVLPKNRQESAIQAQFRLALQATQAQPEPS